MSRDDGCFDKTTGQMAKGVCMMMLGGFGQKALYGWSFWVGFGAQGTCGYC